MKKTGKTRTTKKAKSPRQAARKKKTPPRRVEDEDFITGSIGYARPATPPGRALAEGRGLGERILEAREMRGLTLEDLSSRTGIPLSTLERVESDRAIPPLGQLIRLGKALEMEMGHFISTGVDRPMSVVRAESRPKVARRGEKVREKYGYVYESLAPEKANRVMEPFLVTLTPTRFTEMSSHDGQEFIFVLDGKIRVKVGREVTVLSPGDSIYYDSSRPHLVKCYGKKPARILAVLHAGGK
jgi:quercetin dioxygenase-like cupin family protein/ribosome-binding protein aMBF1 (putative translation factor)